MESKVEIALQNARLAFSKLEEFAAEPVVNDRDRAGVIQAFEFTFEAVWKLFQKIAEREGLEAVSPRRAIGAALDLGICADETLWLGMLEARNLTSHVYREEVARHVFEEVRQRFVAAFRQALEKAALEIGP